MTDNAQQPAFPCTEIETDMNYDREVDQHFPHTYTYDSAKGLTKRELLAAMAMQGLLMGTRCANAEIIVKDAILAADALLAELAKN